jgi:uncharacterized protein YqfA (UPF0365 family)
MLEPSTIVIIIAALIGVVLFFYFVPIQLWLAAAFSGARVSIPTLIAMRLRRVSPAIIVNARIAATKAGLKVDSNSLESHYLAGGNVHSVISALISASKADIELSFNKAAAIDLAGRDVFEAVQMSVNPRIITTPKVTAMAKDGIQLSAVSRVTLRANLDKLVGGAGEETVLARVGEGIVTTIGSANDHKAVLENPDRISKMVLDRGLDAGTAYEILSIDIADIDVGANIGAKLQTEQAEADKQIAQAKAEGRRAMAVAEEQENKALIEEMRAKVVEAEAEVPRAIARAFENGHLGVMDYYQYRNIMADTAMRDAISKADGGDDA